MRDNSCAMSNVGAKSTRVIEVMMRVHDVLDRFARNELLHLPDYSQRPVFILRSLDHRNEVAELDSHTIVRSTADQPNSLCQLLRFHTDRRDRRLPHIIRNRESSDSHIRLDIGYADLHPVVTGIQSRVSLM